MNLVYFEMNEGVNCLCVGQQSFGNRSNYCLSYSFATGELGHLWKGPSNCMKGIEELC